MFRQIFKYNIPYSFSQLLLIKKMTTDPSNLLLSDKKNAQKCGCYVFHPSKYGIKHDIALVPLRKIDYNIEIVNGLMCIKLTQIYYNPLDKFLEVDYSMPIDPNSCIFNFQAKFGDKIVEGIVK